MSNYYHKKGSPELTGINSGFEIHTVIIDVIKSGIARKPLILQIGWTYGQFIPF